METFSKRNLFLVLKHHQEKESLCTQTALVFLNPEHIILQNIVTWNTSMRLCVMIMVKFRQNRNAYVINAKKINLIRSHHEVRMVILMLDIFLPPCCGVFRNNSSSFLRQDKELCFRVTPRDFLRAGLSKSLPVHIGTY